MNPGGRKDIVLKLIAIAVSVCSLLFAVFSNNKAVDLENQNADLNLELIQKASMLLDNQYELREQYNLIHHHQITIDSLVKLQKQNKLIEDSLLTIYHENKSLIDSLKKHLNEIIIIPDFDNNQHIEFFFQWTDPGGFPGESPP
jgi:hypothetical protein